MYNDLHNIRPYLNYQDQAWFEKEQQKKIADCVDKFRDYLKCRDEIAPEYQECVNELCFITFAEYLDEQKRR